jgi:hypothetical protein
VLTKSNTDVYRKKQFNKGKFHALGAVRMAMPGYFQERIRSRLHRTPSGDRVFRPLLGEQRAA